MCSQGFANSHLGLESFSFANQGAVTGNPGAYFAATDALLPFRSSMAGGSRRNDGSANWGCAAYDYENLLRKYRKAAAMNNLDVRNAFLLPYAVVALPTIYHTQGTY